MGRHTRKSEINRRRTRRQRLVKLRRRYASAKNENERSQVLEKLTRVSPAVSREQFLAPTAQKS